MSEYGSRPAFLTSAELIELTGYRRPHRQASELRRRGWHFETTAGGVPVVSRAYTEHRLAGRAEQHGAADQVARQ